MVRGLLDARAMVGTLYTWFSKSIDIATDRGTQRVLSSDTDLHAAASSSSAIIARPTSGTPIAVYASSSDYDGWLLACDLASGELGFMRVDDLADSAH